MQRKLLLSAYFFIPIAIGSVNCFSQQYPFVHYTPKDGLISNQVKNIYQDSKGRLYFSSVNGLSVYDGSRFINYTSRNGLNYNIVNCVMEMGDDSIWIVTNSTKINCLVKGKLKDLPLKDMNYVINNLCRDEKGDLYAATEQGLCIFNNRDRFSKLPFIGTNGHDVNFYIAYLFSVGDYLLVQRDNSLLPDQNNILYLYNKSAKKITAEIPDIYAVHVAPDGRIWVSTKKNIKSVDTSELAKGKLVLKELPAQYDQIKNLGGYFLLFDKGNNCWLGDQSSVLIKAKADGSVTTFTSASGLIMLFINFIFQDREGISWIATNNAGVSKLVHSNFSFIEKPFGISSPSGISYNQNDGGLLLYSIHNSTAAVVNDDKQDYYKISNENKIEKLIETPYGFFGIRPNAVYKLIRKNNILYPEIILTDSIDNAYSNSLVDNNGNFIVCGKYHLSAIINGKIICKVKLPFFSDYAALDSKGNIWVATRASDLIMYHPRSEDPLNYFQEKLNFKIEIPGISPRCILIDQHDNIWIGTRDQGIHVFYLQDGNLVKKFSLTTASGLSDDFITHLSCDKENNIWACSFLGLDKITLKNETPVIENFTKQNNIYQGVFKVAVDKHNVVWGLVSNGIIKIVPEKKQVIDYLPTLMVSMLKAGKDTIFDAKGTSLTSKQNNLSFTFGATSFLDEKQIMYSYRLQGGSNNQWSEPTNNATISFIDLNPGDYSLEVKATFPAGRYPEQLISYKFSIAPAWWQTWWFRSITSLLIVILLILAFRFYYRRKLEIKLAALEKQQAIEKERTRIATDMHDDLGAGLSRIKFLSETIGIKKQQQQPFEEDVNKIREYSHEMIDKMGEIVWALNEKNDSLSDLLSYTRAYAVEYLSQNGIACNAEIPDNLPSFFVRGEFRRNIYLTLKEALHNVVKHAQASEVQLTIRINHGLRIELRDNGVGFDKNKIRAFSNGLTNMQARIKEIGGTMEIINEIGTLIKLDIPLAG